VFEGAGPPDHAVMWRQDGSLVLGIDGPFSMTVSGWCEADGEAYARLELVESCGQVRGRRIRRVFTSTMTIEFNPCESWRSAGPSAGYARTPKEPPFRGANCEQSGHVYIADDDVAQTFERR
jgi:hypothetical protein